MIERTPVVVAIVVTAVFTPEREIDAFTADRAGMVYGIFLFPENPPDKPGNCLAQPHA